MSRYVVIEKGADSIIGVGIFFVVFGMREIQDYGINS
jgi:hypothetical protein